MNDCNVDVVLQKAMLELKSDSIFMIKLGITPIDKERECYSGFIITTDIGSVHGEQMVFPGGKSMKLPKQETEALARRGFVEGVVKDGIALCVEQTAWWAEKCKRMLLHTLLSEIPNIKIFIVDHLGKHMDKIWAVSLAKVPW